MKTILIIISSALLFAITYTSVNWYFSPIEQEKRDARPYVEKLKADYDNINANWGNLDVNERSKALIEFQERYQALEAAYPVLALEIKKQHLKQKVEGTE